MGGARSGAMRARRFREKTAMAEAKARHKDAMERFIALQFLFDKQWKAVKARCLLLYPLWPSYCWAKQSCLPVAPRCSARQRAWHTCTAGHHALEGHQIMQ